ncbi:MAG: hypothetical protein GY765_07295 [bacterium]|nr:hypothetical protein [bacterium]
MDKKVILKVNDREIPLNGFVNTMIANVVDGMVDSLDKIPAKRNKIEILIEEEEHK